MTHLLLSFAEYLNEDVKRIGRSFRNDQALIRKEYLNNFKTYYYFFLIVRIASLIFFLLFFSLLTYDEYNNFKYIFYGISYLFIIVGCIDYTIILYIISYTALFSKKINIFYHFVKIFFYNFLVLSLSSNILFIDPSFIANLYHKYSFLGRGFGATSSSQLIQIDLIQAYLGEKFDYREIVDQNLMVDQSKLEVYAKVNSIDI